MDFLRLEKPPERERVVDDLKQLTPSGPWLRWFSRIFSAFNLLAPSVGLDNGNASVTLTVGKSAQTQIFNTAITADRTVTLETVGAHIGARFRIVRQAGATGAFNIDVGGIHTLTAADQWVDVEMTSTGWIRTAWN